MRKPMLILSLLLGGLLSLSSCSKDSDKGKTLASTPTTELSQAEKDGLIFMREEEKLARDVYMKLNDTYSQQIFTNISASEQVHMDSILTLLMKYNIDDPADPMRGVFNNQDLQMIYDDLVALGSNSLLDAMKVGAKIEELDIRDLIDYNAITTRIDILDAYDFLSCGSRNHLRSFNKQVVKNGGTYTTEFLSQQEYDDIAASAHEMCGN